MRSVNPAEPLPVDREAIKTLRPSYKFLACTQLRRGHAVNPDLIGDDRPDLLEAFYARERRWLETGSAWADEPPGGHCARRGPCLCAPGAADNGKAALYPRARKDARAHV